MGEQIALVFREVGAEIRDGAWPASFLEQVQRRVPELLFRCVDAVER